MYDKILNKYKIVSSCGKGKVVAEYNHDKYIIETVAKDKQSNTLSYTTKNLSGISHQNISNLIIDEDDENFYFIQKEYDGVEILENKGLDYADLIKCYMQIISAISYIHQKDLYHGNINPKNILVDYENNVYLLDFGRGYLYSILKNERNKIFYAPERISENEICQESDIYSFGLCMIKLIVDNFEDFDFCE
ncbi:protein kinase domain-containing protein, partial [Campylobacter concisus]